MITTVIKRDGSSEPFSAEKLNKWAEWAAELGGSWSEVAQQTFKRLSDNCTTKDIHATMVDVCLNKQTIEYSRLAARLELAELRKGMQWVLGIDDTASFEEIFSTLEDYGIWDSGTLPSFNERWNSWYEEIRDISFEFWQIKQWVDKYAIRIDDIAIETPAIGYMGIALALFGDTEKAKDYALALAHGKINLPTPALNGLRNGDWDTISCCVISGGDTTDSIAVADYIAFRMTAKKAGIGIEFTTRSKGDSVKGGRVKHLGKWPIFKMVDRTVKCLTQITRGGNATATILAIDPEIESILFWKSQRVDIEQRIDKLDYEFGYNDAFIEAVRNKDDWYLFSIADAPEVYRAFYTASAEEYKSLVKATVAAGVKHKKVKALELLVKYLTVRQETGRFYDNNLTRTNTHTPFLDTIVQSNLCEEIALPTKPYPSMHDLVATEKSQGETAFCSLSALNVAKIEPAEYEHIADLALEAVDIMIDHAPMMAPSMKESIMRRRSVGIGITGLASALYKQGMDYDGSEESLNYVRAIAERHYYSLLKASQRLAKESGIHVDGINLNWLPIDTAKGTPVLDLDWEALRGNPRKHSVLVAHMPTESSSLLSGSSNGLYPVRRKVINKRSRKGLVQFICDEFDPAQNKTAWQVDNITLSRYYSAVQDSSDQAISCDYYVVPSEHPGGKVSMAGLVKEFVIHAMLGNKTRYYLNTKDDNGGSFQDVNKAGSCSEAGKIYPENFTAANKHDAQAAKGVAEYLTKQTSTEQPNSPASSMVIEEEEDGCQGGCKL